MSHDWYRTFFQGIVLDMWRKAVTPEQTRTEVDFLERHLRLRPGARVLDVPCGSGRHAVALAARGYSLTGVDLSLESIEEARRLSTEGRLPVQWRHGDMRDLPWDSEFDAAFCFGNSFGYLEPEGMRVFVSSLARALKPGARFALDTGMTAESILPNLQEKQWARVDDILFLEENRYLPLESVFETTYTFARGGETHVGTGRQCVYTVRELLTLLREAGLSTIEVYGSLAGEAFQVGAPILLLVAEKSDSAAPARQGKGPRPALSRPVTPPPARPRSGRGRKARGRG
jgi:SAM-dependent methyltransferase